MGGEDIIRVNLREYCGIEEVAVKTYNRTETYSADKFIKLVRTYSSLRALDDETRAALHAKIRRTINDFGGAVEHPFQAALFFAKVKHAG